MFLYLVLTCCQDLSKLLGWQLEGWRELLLSL
uniref:Uncharacterized protein n=1 Tax=Anguilla anguilla TaxID=7936 RepID=A0A0E9SMY4_ANGAN